MKKFVTLALETGIYRGSACLLKDGREVNSLVGESEQSKTEEVLELVKRVLYSSGIGIEEIDEIVISIGPGSYTGLRAGFSIAKGLKMALGINIRGVSPLEEMLKNLRPITLAILPFGKTEICWKESGGEKSNSSRLQNDINFTSRLDFGNVIKQLKPVNLILPFELYNELTGFMSFSTDNLNIIHCDSNLACLIGQSSRLSRNFIYDEEIRLIYPKPFKVK